MSDTAVSVPVALPPAKRIQRWTPLSVSFSGAAVLVLVAFAFVPVLLSQNLTQKLTSLFILAILAAMWNALAGYGGLVSVGQQAFIGIGAYGTVFLADKGVKPYLAMILAALIAAGISIPISFVVLRFRAAQFAIGMWVIAEVFAILVSLDTSLGAGTGTSLIELNFYSPQARLDYNYWLTFGSGVLLLTVVFLLLRSRLGASMQAIRDDEEAAASVGVRVATGKRILFVIAAGGCGIAGACILANEVFIQPTSIFSVQYTAWMIFMALVGGLGTFEGPIIGAVVLFFVQQEFGNDGAWYLVGLGAAAIVFALLLPRGIWGTVEERLGIQLMPVGYRVRGIGKGRGPEPPTPRESAVPVEKGLPG